MKRLRHVHNCYFIGRAVTRKEPSRQTFSHLVPLHNVTTNKWKNLKGNLACFHYSIDEEIQEPERLGDLLKVTQLVVAVPGLDPRSSDLRTSYSYNLLCFCYRMKRIWCIATPYLLPPSVSPQRQVHVCEQVVHARQELTWMMVRRAGSCRNC